MKPTRCPIALYLLGACAVLGGCCHVPKPPAMPGDLVVQTKASCPTSFVVAELLNGQTCAGLAAKVGLNPVPIAFPEYLKTSRVPMASGNALAPAADVLTDRKVGKKTYCVLASTERNRLEGALKLGVARMTVDCPLLAGSGMSAAEAGPLMQATLRQTRGGAVSSSAAPAPIEPWTTDLPADASGVQIAVIDSSPFGLAQADTSGHGYSVSHAIASVACPNGSEACLAQVRPYLALPMVSVQGTPQFNEKGGYFGHLHQLGDAIERAVNAPRTGRLVINLSLGWDPDRTVQGDPDASYVLQALRHASCSGALIVAAAGNLSGSEGPMLPGGYERMAAPKDCSEFGMPPNGADRPLVYAAAGVDASDTFLGTTRPQGRPRLVAYGLYGVMQRTGLAPAAFVGPISGTSAASAFVSGIAAAAWSVGKNLAPEALIESVYGGGLEISTQPADFCFHPPCRERPRRISLCGALGQVGPAPKCTPVPLAADLAPGMIPPAPPANLPATSPTGSSTTAPIASSQPWVSPQDPISVCSTCLLFRRTNGLDTFWGSTIANTTGHVLVIASAAIIGSNGFWTQPSTLPRVPSMGGTFSIDVSVFHQLWNFDATASVRWNMDAGFSTYQITDGVYVYGP
jgi:hypothetical protein